MSASTEAGSYALGAQPTLSSRIAELTTPGVVVEVDAAEAESLGAFEETALTEADAWEANADLPPADGEAADGD